MESALQPGPSVRLPVSTPPIPVARHAWGQLGVCAQRLRPKKPFPLIIQGRTHLTVLHP